MGRVGRGEGSLEGGVGEGCARGRRGVRGWGSRGVRMGGLAPAHVLGLVELRQVCRGERRCVRET